MNPRHQLRRTFAALLIGVLVGGGLLAVTPAGAEVSAAVATNWKKIWKKNLKPLADKRYYTKSQSDGKYQPKGSYAPAGSSYTKAESDGRYAGAGTSYPKAESDSKYAAAGSSYTKAESDGKYAATGSSYTKAESDGKYVAKPKLITGSWGIGSAPTGGFPIGNISFGAVLSAAPATHIRPVGAAPTAQCPGSAAAPAAAAGNLCIYTAQNSSMTAPYTFGVRADSVLVSASAASNNGYAWGTWAVRPIGYAPLAPLTALQADSLTGASPGR